MKSKIERDIRYILFYYEGFLEYYPPRTELNFKRRLGKISIDIYINCQLNCITHIAKNFGWWSAGEARYKNPTLLQTLEIL